MMTPRVVSPKTSPLSRAPKRRRLPSREKVEAITTSLALPRLLHERAKIAATHLNWTLAELCRAALEEFLARHGYAAPRRKGGR